MTGTSEKFWSCLKRRNLLLESGNFLSKKWNFWAHFGRGLSTHDPGKLRAIEKWEVPRTVSALRAFLGFTNYYSSYIKDYANMVARLMEKLKVPRDIGKKGSKAVVGWDEADLEAFRSSRKHCVGS